jgi:hypothetical protein
MTNEEVKLREELAAATAAENALEILATAFERLEQEYITAWKSTPARDADARERLWQAVQIVGRVEAHLRTSAANRKLTERQLAEIARLGDRKRIFGAV